MDFFEFRAAKGEQADEDSERIAHEVIGALIEVHKVLGPGFPENVYANALRHELTLRSITFEYELTVPVMYRGRLVGEGRIDLLVASKVIVELKSVEKLLDVHRDQLVAYLAALKLRLGFLANFNVEMMKQGIKRVVFDPAQPS